MLVLRHCFVRGRPSHRDSAAGAVSDPSRGWGCLGPPKGVALVVSMYVSVNIRTMKRMSVCQNVILHRKHLLMRMAPLSVDAAKHAISKNQSLRGDPTQACNLRQKLCKLWQARHQGLKAHELQRFSTMHTTVSACRLAGFCLQRPWKGDS